MSFQHARKKILRSTIYSEQEQLQDMLKNYLALQIPSKDIGKPSNFQPFPEYTSYRCLRFWERDDQSATLRLLQDWHSPQWEWTFSANLVRMPSQLREVVYKPPVETVFTFPQYRYEKMKLNTVICLLIPKESCISPKKATPWRNSPRVSCWPDTIQLSGTKIIRGSTYALRWNSLMTVKPFSA